jgi:hypothetical protein
MKIRKSHLSLYILFLFTATIVVLNRYTEFHINDFRIHLFFNFFAASSFVVIVGHFFGKLQSFNSIFFTFLIVGLLVMLKAFFTWGGDWKTQTILYRNIENESKTINFQLRGDRFAFGYKKRIIEIHKLAPFMEWTTDVDTLTIDKKKWERVDLKLNQMKLPN